MGIPTWIHEAELHLGLANRILSFCADKVSVTSEQVQFPIPQRKIVYTGHPVRRDIVQGAAWEGEKIPSRLLILGGSQGSRSLDLAISKFIPFFALHKIEIFHQCRAESQAELRKEYASCGVSAQVEPFIHELAKAYAWAHAIVGRSGAGTVTEISLIGKPSIFVPYPHAQGNHQFFNAKTLVEKGKALIVEEGEGFDENLKVALEKIFDPQEFQKMRERGLEEKPVNAASKIADGVRGLARYTARS
jgi:UDP-N-acetylglucosamine--N-acetylmuramyl-(pentapeptide) pyrophosphoryl-undecaprenol N-acetylglucosamine transferase